MLDRIVKTALFYRIAEGFIPFLTWAIILLPLWLSPFRPAVAAYCILAFMIYFLYKSMKTVYYAGVAYMLMERLGKIDWLKKLKKSKGHEDIFHFMVITNYKESVAKLEKTLQKIREQKYDLKKIYVVLAMEEREGDEAKKRSMALQEKFEGIFADFITTYHVMQPGEVVGKASNEAYAARCIEKIVVQKNISLKHVLITICDADSLLPPQYTAYLTLEFLKDPDRIYHFYWAPVLLYNNFWRMSMVIRVQSILGSVIRLSLLPQKDDLIQISTYSTNLWLLKEVGYWDPDIIPEDWHIWFQAFFKFGTKVKTLPIYLPVSADPIFGKGYLNTFKNRYEQERRWAWGASDIPYAIKRSFQTPHIPFFSKLRKVLFLMEIHVFWPSSFFILTLSAFIPPLVNPGFKRTVMGFLLPKLSSFILTSSSLLLIFIIYFDHKMREKIKIKTELKNVPLLLVQWYFLPVISFFFSSLPALEAHTRMLFGKKLEYKVTEKDES